MNRVFTRSIMRLLGLEGGYSDHLLDPGGKTMYGITEDLAREYGYEGDMKDLPLEKAKEIYWDEFWENLMLTDVARRSEEVAFKILDIAVNCGKETAVKFFQRSLNAFNNNEDYYKDIKVDGYIGEKTIGAWKEYHSMRQRTGNEVMFKALRGLQTSYYIRLAEHDPETYEAFVFGWINQRIK